METLDQNMLHSLMWYIFGIFTYRIAAKIFNYSQIYHTLSEMMTYILYMLRLAYKNHEQSCEYQIEYSRKQGASDEEIVLQQKKNSSFLEMWKAMCIANLINSTPQNLRGMLRFKNWDEAMKILEKGEKDVSI